MHNFSIVRLRRFRGLLWCLAVSLLFHFVILPLVVNLFGIHPQHARQPVVRVVYQVRSSALRIAPRPRPQTHRFSPAVPHVAQARQPQPQPQQRQPRSIAAPPRREIARIEPHALHNTSPRFARPQPRQQMNLAQQETQFEKAIAQMRRQADPILSAAHPVPSPEAPKHYSFDIAGQIGSKPVPEGVLTPVKSWRDGIYDYYYVAYFVQYADGTTESGYVPWPIRFPNYNNPFKLHPYDVPLPPPLPDYVLPSGTNLHPFVAYCYQHRAEYPDSCPIAHA
jgi:hypothetical protein